MQKCPKSSGVECQPVPDDTSDGHPECDADTPAHDNRTCWASSGLWDATYPSAHEALSFTQGSKSSRQETRASRAPHPATDCAKDEEWRDTALKQNAADFLQ